ncbi:MAG TPA: DUF4159 domain-containing protein [Longimicrobiales bacterium]|nr:DUF4159 domain-containing protein [Longimicrobiales bacterium]
MRLFGSIVPMGIGAGVLAAALLMPGIAGESTDDVETATDLDPPVRMPGTTAAPDASRALAFPVAQAPPPPGYSFYFTRAIYSGRRSGWGGGRGSWSTDFPEAEFYFTQLLGRLIDIDVFTERGGRNPTYLDDPNLRRFPFLYVVEPGGMNLTEPEIRGLRSYLEAGGFMMMDDFWGVRETANVEYQLAQVLPGRPVVEIPLDHEIFQSVYGIDEIRQVPNVRNGRDVAAGWAGARTDEGDNSEVPYVRGIFDDEGRLMVIINQNTDLGDAWEWAEDPWYPLDFSTYATEVGINTVVYAMSH